MATGLPHSWAEDAELSLLVTACFASAGNAGIGGLLERGVDWTRLVQLNLHHRVTGFLLPALEAAPPSLVASEVLDALRVYREATALQERELTDELFALLDAFRGRSIPVVPFKGPLLGWKLYGEPARRPPGDLDLLFHRRDVTTVREVLESRGYEDIGQRPGVPSLTDVQRRMYEHCQCEYTYTHPERSAVVEPHWDLTPHPLAIDLDYERMVNAAVHVPVAGRIVPMLDDRHLALALSVHGAKHRWSRLAWIADLATLLRSITPDDVDAIYTAARRQGCGRIWLLSVDLARRFTRLLIGPDVARALQRDKRLPALCAESLGGLAHPDRPEPDNARVDWFRFRLREAWSDRARYVVRTMTTPGRHHLESVRLSPGFGWGYYLIKIGADIALWRW